MDGCQRSLLVSAPEIKQYKTDKFSTKNMETKQSLQRILQEGLAQYVLDLCCIGGQTTFPGRGLKRWVTVAELCFSKNYK